ncbi:MAG: peptidase inhibitor family I36 protein [Caulobacterales bacterium]|nr:peptidase inhibitor family I36 protein [Caulobacterales bacterium]
MKTGYVVAFVAALSASAVAARAQPVQIPGGSYRASCSNVNAYRGPNGGKIVTARCRMANGGWFQSSLRFDGCRGDIANINGRLICGSNPGPVPGGNPGPLPPGSLTLFGQPGYRGSSVVLRGPAPSLTPWGFGDKAKSLQIRGRGRWQVCTKVNYGGRCEIIGDSVYDLATWQLRNQISSARPVGR